MKTVCASLGGIPVLCTRNTALPEKLDWKVLTAPRPLAMRAVFSGSHLFHMPSLRVPTPLSHSMIAHGWPDTARCSSPSGLISPLDGKVPHSRDRKALASAPRKSPRVQVRDIAAISDDLRVFVAITQLLLADMRNCCIERLDRMQTKSVDHIICVTIFP